MKRRVVIALAIGLTFYAFSDIQLWQRIFEGHSLFQFEYQYQTGHLVTLVALIGIGMVLLWDARLWALWYGGAFYTLAFGGVCDVLYYWLDGRELPKLMPWLDSGQLLLFQPATVTSSSLLLSASIWCAFWTALLFAPQLLKSLSARRRWLFPVAEGSLLVAGLHDHDVVPESDHDHDREQRPNDPTALQLP